MVVLSWNLAGRVRRLPEQADRVLGAGADIVCLQELTQNTVPIWRGLLLEAGYAGVEAADVDRGSGRKRPFDRADRLPRAAEPRGGGRHPVVRTCARSQECGGH